jgi:methylthioribose-1-phosphate isomerase
VVASAVGSRPMDANELSELLEDVREYMKHVATGENASILENIKNVAKENTAACSAIGHIIEQYLLKVRCCAHYVLCFLPFSSVGKRM